jgi:cobalt-zinc-cadmium efflux system outer membrane protein
MRLAAILVVLSSGLALSQAAAQPPESPIPPAPMPDDGRRVVAGQPAGPPRGSSVEHIALAPTGQSSASGLTLGELEEMALQYNPTLEQAAARAEAARGHWLQVGLYPNPVAGYLGAEIGNEGRAGQQGGFLSQEIVTAKKLQLSRNVASQEVRQAEYAWEAQRQRVLTDVRRTFYEVLIAQRTAELAAQLVRIGEEGVRSTEALMKAKEVARGDLLQSRIEADTARVFLERARNRHLAAWRSLAAVVGAADMEPRPLAGDIQDGLPQLTWDDAFARILAQSPQMAGAQTGVARAQAAVSRECAGRVPNLELQGTVQYDHATRDTFATVQVGIPMPIFNRNQGNILRAQAELLAAENEVQRVQLALRQRLAGVFEQYTNARYQAEKYSRDILPNAAESLKLTNSGYKQGEYSYLAVLTAQRTFFRTNLAYLDALRELRAAATTIEGNLLSDSLQAGESSDRDLSQGAAGVPGALVEALPELR